MTSTAEKSRCKWSESDPLLRDYHDTEWGVPQRDSRALWELLMLEGFQAGLAWIIVLRKRDEFRKAFKGFDPARVTRFGEADIERLLQNQDVKEFYLGVTDDLERKSYAEVKHYKRRKRWLS